MTWEGVQPVPAGSGTQNRTASEWPIGSCPAPCSRRRLLARMLPILTLNALGAAVDDREHVVGALPAAVGEAGRAVGERGRQLRQAEAKTAPGGKNAARRIKAWRLGVC